MNGRRGRRAWAVLGIAILVYETVCDEEDLLSVVVDAWLESHPVLTRKVIYAIADHLANEVDPSRDPIHLLSLVVRYFRGRSWRSISTS